MATKKKAASIPDPSEQELEEAVRELVSRASGLLGTEFKKELSAKYKKFDKGVLQAAERLAAAGEVHRWSSARKVRFFASDPLEMLPGATRAALDAGPGTEAELVKRIESTQRGLGDLFKEWQKQALVRGEIFQHPPLAGSKTKRYSKEPDVSGLLKKVIVELKKIAESAVGKRVPPERFLEVMASALGVTLRDTATPFVNERQRFLDALTEFSRAQARGALLSVRELRTRVALPKVTFDAIALELSAEGIVTLHHHDFPSSLPEVERGLLVVDSRGTHYVGIALTRDS